MLFVDIRKGPHLSSIVMNMRRDNLIIGEIWLIPISEHCYQIHLSEVIWKERGHTLAFLKEALRVGFASIEKLEKVFAFIPVDNTLVIKLTQKCSFKKEGQLTKSHMKNGKMIDQVIYSFSKEKLLCHN